MFVSLDENIKTMSASTRYAVLLAGIAAGCCIIFYVGRKRQRKVRPTTARPRQSTDPALVPTLAFRPDEIPNDELALSESHDSDTNRSTLRVSEAHSWSLDESKTLMQLLYSIAQDKAHFEGIVHRSISCNHCGSSPIRGYRFKCANCTDFDLCAACESIDEHNSTHVFVKIRIPLPPLANPRTRLFAPLYPAKQMYDPIFTFAQLEKETHFDTIELLGIHRQFLSLSTLDDEKAGIELDVFERCLGSVGRSGNIIIERMFNFYDQDHDGVISFPEMVKGLSVLCKGSLEERTKCINHIT